MDQLTLIRGANCWLLKFEGPHAQEVIDLFGTDTLPTPFTELADAATVQAEIKRLNAGAHVLLAS
jgi:hypothetical protein